MEALSSTSQRRTSAARFANALRVAIKKRGGSKVRVADAAAIPRSNLGYYLAGRNLPTLEVAHRLADVLDADELVRIVIAGRTVRCGRPGCKREFLYEGGRPKVYCSEDCAGLAAKMRSGHDLNDDGAKTLYTAVKGEVERVHGTMRSVRRKVLTAALDEYARSGSKRHRKLTMFQRRLDAYAESIDAMCRGCEPEGLCRTPECPLRAFSPLPLRGTYTEERPTGKIRPAEGPHGPTYKAAWLEAQLDANARRWSRPGERELQAERTRARWAALSPEERAERGRLISERRRAS